LRTPSWSHDEMLHYDWLDAVDLSMTSCSQTSLNRFVSDMTGGGKTRHGFVYNILTRQAVVDKSVSGLYKQICLRFVVDMSIGGKTRHGFARMWRVLDKSWPLQHGMILDTCDVNCLILRYTVSKHSNSHLLVPICLSITHMHCINTSESNVVDSVVQML